MAIPVLGASNFNLSYNSTTLSVTKPSGIVEGDVLLVRCYNNAITTSDQFSTSTTGWTRDFQVASPSANGVAVAVFTRVATGDASDTTFVLNIAESSGSIRTYANYAIVSGVDTDDIWDASTSRIYGSATSTFQTNAFTSSVDDSLAIQVSVQFGGNYPIVSNSGFPPWIVGELHNTGLAFGIGGGLASLGLATAGTIAACRWSDGSNPSSKAVCIAANFNPAPFQRRIFIS